jgi:urease accessory protein UreF
MTQNNDSQGDEDCAGVVAAVHVHLREVVVGHRLAWSETLVEASLRILQLDHTRTTGSFIIGSVWPDYDDRIAPRVA